MVLVYQLDLCKIVAFVILLYLLLLCYKPVLKMLHQRARKIKDSMDEVQKVKEQAAQTGGRVQERKSNAASKEGQEVISKAMRTG